MNVKSSLSMVFSTLWCHQPRLASAVFFSSSSVKAPCAASIGTPRPKNEASPFFTARRHAAGRLPRMRFSIALVEALELDVGGGTPARGAGAGRLVDLQVGDRVLAQPVPVAVDVPGRADHGAGLMPRPEAGDQAAAQLVAVLVEDAGQLQDAGIAGGVVGGLRVRARSPGGRRPRRSRRVWPLTSPIVICTGRQPFSTLARNHTRTGPAFSISRSFRPAVRAMPMQGSVAISVL